MATLIDFDMVLLLKMVDSQYTKADVSDKLLARQRLPNLGLLRLRRGFGNPLGAFLNYLFSYLRLSVLVVFGC
jgi:hypothetical protein